MNVSFRLFGNRMKTTNIAEKSVTKPEGFLTAERSLYRSGGKLVANE